MCGEGRAVSSWGRGRGGKGRERDGRRSGTPWRGPKRYFLLPLGTQRGRRPPESWAPAGRRGSITRPVGTATWVRGSGGGGWQSADVMDGLGGPGGRGAPVFRAVLAARRD